MAQYNPLDLAAIQENLLGHRYRYPDPLKGEWVTGLICQRCGAISDEKSGKFSCQSKERKSSIMATEVLDKRIIDQESINIVVDGV